MKIIGLTGGSGTGKGTVAQLFERLGAQSVDADAVYHTLCRESKPMITQLQTAFGDVRALDGSLDRKKLGPIVFADSQKLKQLADITTPFIEKAVQRELVRAQLDAFVLLDAPTLYETGLDSLCEQVIAVLADTQTRLARIMARDGLEKGEAHARISAQPSDAFYQSRAQYIIENNASLEALSDRVKQIYEIIVTT